MNAISFFDTIKEKGEDDVYESTFRLCKYSDRYQTGKKVLHKMMDILVIVLFATLANADDWVEMEVFGKEHEDFCGIIWNFRMEFSHMIPVREFSLWCHRNF